MESNADGTKGNENYENYENAVPSTSSASGSRSRNSRGRFGKTIQKNIHASAGGRGSHHHATHVQSRSGQNRESSSGDPRSHQNSIAVPERPSLKAVVESVLEPSYTQPSYSDEDSQKRIIIEALIRSGGLHGLIQHYQRNDIKFDTLPLESVQAILEFIQIEMPATMTKQLVYCTHAEDGPNKFTLRLEKQEDRLKLINLVLIHRIESTNPDERIDQVDMQQYTRDNFIGKMVAAPRGFSSGDFARATVLRFTSNDSVLVYFLDYGNTDEIELDRLMNSPLEFLQIRPLCFSAYLADLNPEVAHVESIKRKFRQNFVNRGVLECSVKECNNDSNMWAVSLFKKNAQGRSLNAVEYLLGNEKSTMQPKISGNHVKVPSLSPPPTTTATATATVKCQQPQGLSRNSVEPEPTVAPSPTVAEPQSSTVPPQQTQKRRSYGAFLRNDQKQLMRENAFSVTIQEEEAKPGYARNLKILHIVSPSEIYVEFLIDKSVRRIPECFRNFQEKYNSPQIGKTLRNVTTASPKQCFALKEPGTDKWIRVSVIESDGSKCDVYLVDEGRYLSCSISDLRELPGKCNHPAIASRVHLAQIKSPDQNWSSESITFFKNWCKEGISFKTVIVADEDIPQCYGYHKLSYGIALAREENKDTCGLGTIQTALCKNDLAVPLGVYCGRHDLAYSTQAGIPVYEREKLEKELGIPIRVEEDDSTRQYGGNFFWRNSLQYEIGYVDISAVISPGNFYIQMKSKSEDLEKMQEDLRSVAENLEVLPLNGYCVGDIVLGCSCNLSEEKETWLRVAILSINLSDHKAKCVSIDYGFELVINLSKARKLPEYVRSIHPFCHRAHLDFPTFQNNYIPSDNIWSDDADGIFRRYIDSFRNDGPIYYGWEVRPGNQSSFVRLEELNQKVYFDHDCKQWLPGRPVKKRDYVSFNKCRDHPMLKHLFVSVGIDVKYKVQDDIRRREELKSAWDVLLEMGFVVEE